MSQGGGGSSEEPPHLILGEPLRDFGMIDCPDLIALSNRFAGLNLDAAWLHRFGHFALQFDLEQSILERRALHLDKVGEIEATFERPTGDAAVEVLGLVLLLVDATSDYQRVSVNRNADLLGLEASNRKRNAVLVLTGSNDVAGRVIILRLKPKALVHQVEQPIKADAGPPEGI